MNQDKQTEDVKDTGAMEAVDAGGGGTRGGSSTWRPPRPRPRSSNSSRRRPRQTRDRRDPRQADSATADQVSLRALMRITVRAMLRVCAIG